MKKAILLLISPFLIGKALFAQPHFMKCGTNITKEQFLQLSQIKLQSVPGTAGIGSPKGSAVVELKVQFNIVCSGGSSTSPVTSSELTSALSKLNNNFAAAGLHFSSCRAINFIANSPFSNFSFSNQADENAIGSANDVSNVINIYIFNTIGNGFYGGYTYGPGTLRNRLYLAARDNRNNRIFSNGINLSHEMSHFFGLLHTDGYGGGNCTTSELVNGSNALSTGDLVQDTPADPACIEYTLDNGNYNYTYPWGVSSTPCNPPPGNHSFCDANGQTYTPLSNNLMFPTYSTSFNTLTAGQAQRIYSTYQFSYLNKFQGEVDLMSRDIVNDPGTEPNPYSWPHGGPDIWASPDIWNCRTSNSCLTHEEPGYADPSKRNDLRVRIKNNGCNTSLPAKVHTYWTLGSTGETWPASWTNATLCSLPAGGEIPNADGSYGADVPALAGGQETIVTISWKPIDPSPYTCIQLEGDQNGNPEICVLARIVSAQDPITGEANGPIRANITNSNNIVTRNTVLIQLAGHKQGPGSIVKGTILFQNALENESVFDLHIKEIQQNESSYLDNGSLIVTLKDELWESWMSGGHQGSGIEIYNAESRRLLINKPDAVLKNVRMPSGNAYPASFGFYLNNESDQESSHNFIIYQSLSEDGEDELVGSACHINVEISPSFPDFAARSAVEHTVKPAAGLTPFCTLTPNPAVSVAYLNINLDEPADLLVKITDVSGKSVMGNVIKHFPAGNSSYKIDLHAFLRGIYIVNIAAGNKLQAMKLVVGK